MNDFYVGTSAYKLDKYEEYTRNASRVSNEKRQKAKN